MTLDEAIKHCLEVAENNEQFASGKWIGSEGEANRQECEQCAADHRQLAEWLTELKQWRRVYGICPSYEMCIPECREGYNAQIAEYKRLLKAAVEDFAAIAEVHAAATPILCPQYGKYMKAIDVRTRKWRYADEALALIGEEDESNE